MTDTMPTVPDQPETKPVSKAVAVLCAQHIQRVMQENEALAQIAFETDGLDPKAGWRLDIGNACYVLTTPTA